MKRWFLLAAQITCLAGAQSQSMIDMKPGETHLAPAGEVESKAGRWLTLDTASLMTRYRLVRSFRDITTASQQQHQVALAGDFHLDNSGRLLVHAGVFTGSSFLGGWDTTGPGTGVAQSNLYLKQLYVRVRPVSGVEVQYGGLGFARGESSEITSYDADGYLVGQRVTLRSPRSVYFDEVSVTYGYLGDLDSANVFHRFRRLNRANYHQYLVAKQLHKSVRFSADYSSESGQGTFRQAVTFRSRQFRLADLVRFEQYERDGPTRGYGLALYGEKSPRRKLTLGYGFADHDRRGLYSDRFSAGRYLFANALYAVRSSWSVSALVTRGIVSPLSTAPRTRLDVAIGYNFQPALRRAGLI